MMEYLQPYTVSFFGHREIDYFAKAEEQTERIIRKLLNEHPYVEFLVGRDGEYDQIVSSAIRRVKELCGAERCFHTLVLPYPKAEFINNIGKPEVLSCDREIAETTGDGKTTVNEFLKRFRECEELSYPLSEDVTNEFITGCLYKKAGNLVNSDL